MLHRCSALVLFAAVFACRAEKPPVAKAIPETKSVEPSAPATHLDASASPPSDTQKAWNSLRFEAASPSAPARSVASSSSPDAPASPVAEPPPSTLSSMDALWERARGLEPQLQAIAQEADTLDRNFRWYIDACYQKYTAKTWTATSTGSGQVDEHGRAVGRDWFAVWTSASSLAWQESWAGTSVTSNESTVECRKIWSDILHGSRLVASELDRVEDEARIRRILPGHFRRLLATYRLVR
jgi:hypothetical protein